MTQNAAKRQMHFSLLTMPTLAHNDYGIWTHPENQKVHFDDPAFWTEIAKLCEESKMDALFMADGLGITDSFGGSFDVSLSEGMHVPVIDPALVTSSVAAATTHLGFAITAASTFDPPFSHARRMATLDHLTKGRIGWNVVTGFIRNGEDNYGVPPAASSAERYDTTEEFMDVCYKLWEGSWEDDAYVVDPGTGLAIDPAKVHKINHVGEHYSCSGPALWHPSRQRTPVIFQAGMSERGRLFAAKHAEVVFAASAADPAIYKALTADLRAKAEGFGRKRDDMKLLGIAGIVTGEDDAAAQAKMATYEKWTRPQGYLAHVNALNGFNPLVHDRDELLIDALNAGGFKRDDFTAYIPRPDITIGDYMDMFKVIRNSPGTFVGGPEHVADQLEAYVSEFDLDGFLLRSYSYPQSVRDFRDYIVPELQRRGIYRTHYDGSTLRENIFGAGHTRIAGNHSAASFRGAFAGA
jgi:FMN-dependent oxidoreductase (nitrilotriacetate monooxygenase family)